jgi:SprT protein
MQFDFFEKLLAVPPVQPPPPKPAENDGKPLILESAPWLDLARDLLRKAGAEALAGEVKVLWNPRMRSTAGMAYPGKALVTLNPRLALFGDAEIDRTLRHELAHLLAHARAGARRIAPHGTQWRKACADLGLADEQRCHTLPLPRRRMQRPHTYRCPHCGTLLHRARPLRRKIACLACCRAQSGGRYDERFRFVKVPPPVQASAQK